MVRTLSKGIVMVSVWEAEVSTTDRAALQAPVVGKPNIVSLLQAMPDNQGNPDNKAVGDRLKKDLGDNNNGFRSKLNVALADQNVRDRLVELMKNNPAGVRQHLD